MNAPEARVVRDLKRSLLSVGLDGVVPNRILADADPSFIHSPYASELEPMAQVNVGGGRPDLLCSVERTEGTLVTGFEVKASSRDWLQGLAQARRYRAGVHHSYLALPGRADAVERETRTMARETGVGVMTLDENIWRVVAKPMDPTPLPWTLGPTTAALEGVPVARQLQLNHPLNYLVVPFLAASRPAARSLIDELEARWPDLASPATRRHAIIGATSLRLINSDLEPTHEGSTVADLLAALGFVPECRPSKRVRLADVSRPLAAVARFVLLQQPAVRLVMGSLAEADGRLRLPQLALVACRKDPPLGGAMFLADPSDEVRPDLPGAAYNPTTVFKLKQNLWHAGLLATGSHTSAGKRATNFRPDDDQWILEPKRLISR